jgi:hypothetical protein
VHGGHLIGASRSSADGRILSCAASAPGTRRATVPFPPSTCTWIRCCCRAPCYSALRRWIEAYIRTCSCRGKKEVDFLKNYWNNEQYILPNNPPCRCIHPPAIFFTPVSIASLWLRCVSRSQVTGAPYTVCVQCSAVHRVAAYGLVLCIH